MMKAKPLLIVCIVLYLVAVFLVPGHWDLNDRGRVIVQISYMASILCVGILGFTRARGMSFKRKVLADKLLRARVFARSIPYMLGVLTLGILTTFLCNYMAWNYMVDFVLFVLFLYGAWNIFEFTASRVEREVEEM